MKTQTTPVLIALVVLFLGVLGWNTWNEMKVSAAAASVRAAVLGQELAAPIPLLEEWLVKAIVGTLIGGFLAAAGAAGFLWVRRQWLRQDSVFGANRSQISQRQFLGPRQPRPMTESELYRLMLMQQMTGSIPRNPRVQSPPDDIDLNF